MKNHLNAMIVFIIAFFCIFSKICRKILLQGWTNLEKGGKLCLVERSRQIRLTKTQMLKQKEKQFLLKRLPQNNNQNQVVVAGKSLVQQKPANS